MKELPDIAVIGRLDIGGKRYTVAAMECIGGPPRFLVFKGLRRTRTNCTKIPFARPELPGKGGAALDAFMDSPCAVNPSRTNWEELLVRHNTQNCDADDLNGVAELTTAQIEGDPASYGRCLPVDLERRRRP